MSEYNLSIICICHRGHGLTTFEESGWHWMDPNCPKLIWLGLLGEDLSSPMNGDTSV